MNLAGKHVLITGAAHGLGRALAEALAARRARLTLLDIDAAALESTAAALQQSGADVLALPVDVADPAALARAAGALADAGRTPLHLLINNAGVSVQGPFESLPLDDLRWIFDINFWGVVYATRAFLPALRAAANADGRSRIVNILSDFALLGFPTKTGYCGAKFAARGFGESLRAELHGTGVGLLAVYPPAIDTDILKRSRAVDPAKRDKEAAFLKARAWPAGKVAARIVRAIERDRDRLLLGRETHLIDWATRLFPVWTQRMLGRFKGRIEFV